MQYLSEEELKAIDEIAKVPIETRRYIAKLEHIANLAEDIEHPDYPDYDWPSGSTEYTARRKRLRDALKELRKAKGD